jgi:hypothetical protein
VLHLRALVDGRPLLIVSAAQGKDDYNKVIFGIDAICTF